MTTRLLTLAITGLLTTSACDGDNDKPKASVGHASEAERDAGRLNNDSDEASLDAGQTHTAKRFVLASVAIDADGNRVSYAQLIDDLSGNFSNKEGIEQGGNAVFLSNGSDFFYGLEESPEWVRYSTKNGLKETGRLSFQQLGETGTDYNNAIVDDHTAISVLSDAYLAVIWDTSSMQITKMIDLPQLQRDGYSLEASTIVTHDGLVYIPGKWVNWDAPKVMQRVSMTILDPESGEIKAFAQDDRCGAGGQVTFDKDGYAYVMGDGRNQSMQVFAKAAGQDSVPNCLLRIAPGGDDFEADYYIEIPKLTGGLDSMTELQPADIDSGVAFTLMEYPDKIPDGLDQVNFEHWDAPAYKQWRIKLGDQPEAEEVQGGEFTLVGFGPSAVNGKLYMSETSDRASSTVYEIDPDANTSTLKFTMDGYFSGLYPVR